MSSPDMDYTHIVKKSRWQARLTAWGMEGDGANGQSVRKGEAGWKTGDEKAHREGRLLSSWQSSQCTWVMKPLGSLLQGWPWLRQLRESLPASAGASGHQQGPWDDRVASASAASTTLTSSLTSTCSAILLKWAWDTGVDLFHLCLGASH